MGRFDLGGAVIIDCSPVLFPGNFPWEPCPNCLGDPFWGVLEAHPAGKRGSKDITRRQVVVETGRKKSLEKEVHSQGYSKRGRFVIVPRVFSSEKTATKFPACIRQKLTSGLNRLYFL